MLEPDRKLATAVVATHAVWVSPPKPHRPQAMGYERTDHGRFPSERPVFSAIQMWPRRTTVLVVVGGSIGPTTVSKWTTSSSVGFGDGVETQRGTGQGARGSPVPATLATTVTPRETNGMRQIVVVVVAVVVVLGSVFVVMFVCVVIVVALHEFSCLLLVITSGLCLSMFDK